MSEIDLKRLRDLRRRADKLLQTLVPDLEPFSQSDRLCGFRRKPDSKSEPDDVNVTTTCSCLMALTLAGKLCEFYPVDTRQTVSEIFVNILKAPWESSGLPKNNAFTTTLILRTFGFLVQAADAIDDTRADKVDARERTPGRLTTSRLTSGTGSVEKADDLSTHLSALMGVNAELGGSSKQRSLKSIAEKMSGNIKRFKINRYEPAAAVVYWFVDGVARAEMELPGSSWDRLCVWAAEEFARQRSLVVAKHAAMMDPVAMAMAACLCARLRAIGNQEDWCGVMKRQAVLPSPEELEQAVLELFGEQIQDSGIWPKYFPLFHYQEAGSNFCFTFELLEAVLKEFGTSSLIGQETFVGGLDKAVLWCERHRLLDWELTGGTPTEYNGWNSGGSIETLHKGQPESWATAVVHMFLWELVEVLSRAIQECILEKYSAGRPKEEKWKKIDDLLDIELWLKQRHEGLKKTLRHTIVASFDGESDTSLRVHRPEKKTAVSALLFGPPGTSKTGVAKAVAAELEWPLVQIDPSHFLQGGFHRIYVEAESIFKDIEDLSGAVVLFDELDALVQRRDQKQTAVDTEARFLTTYMLPKLSRLHDSGRVAFFMATNFLEDFDEAIKRAGRFDLLLCMGPPMLRDKCQSIQDFYDLGGKQTTETKKAGHRIQQYCESGSWLQQQLELYTHGEFRTLLHSIGDATNIGTTVDELGPGGFKKRVEADCKTAGLRFDELEPILDKYGCETVADLDSVPDIDFKTFDPGDSRVIAYVRDRRQSKHQGRTAPGVNVDSREQRVVDSPS